MRVVGSRLGTCLMKLCGYANENRVCLDVEGCKEELHSGDGDARVGGVSIELVGEKRLVAWDCGEALGMPLRLGMD